MAICLPRPLQAAALLPPPPGDRKLHFAMQFVSGGFSFLVRVCTHVPHPLTHTHTRASKHEYVCTEIRDMSLMQVWVDKALGEPYRATASSVPLSNQTDPASTDPRFSIFFFYLRAGRGYSSENI